MTTLGALIVSFFRTYLANQKGYTANTIASYSDCIRLLLSYSCQRLDVSFDKLGLEMVSDQLILDFLDHLEASRGNATTTRNQRLGAIKTFFRFLALQEPTTTAVCERVCAISAKKTEHKVLATLENTEVETILAATQTSTDTLQGARDHALLLMLYNTGARVQELVGANVCDVRMEAPVQVCLTGKGRKQRVVPLYDETIHAIQHYLKLRKGTGLDHQALFTNARGARITRFGIGHIVSKYAALAARSDPCLSGKTITPHTYRHTIALHLIQSGVDITVVKAWLGHADIKTTSLYIDINTEMKRKALEACPPPPSAAQTPETEKPLWHNPTVLQFLQSLSHQARPALC
jgi:integrase/recombinase XerD